MKKRSEPILSLFEGKNLTGVAYKDNERRKEIINEITTHEEITINEISESLNISVPKATELLMELAREGFVKEKGKRSDGPGRKAAYYGLTQDCAYFLGLEIRKYKLNIGLMGFDKTMVLQQNDIPFFVEESNKALDEIVKILQDFLESAEVEKEKIAGIGISIAGRINVRTGDILTIYHLSDAPLKSTLEKAFNIPVLLDNDSRTLAYGEYHFGKVKKETEVLVLNLDYGMALGIFVKGKPLFGASGYAGELGHIPMFNNEKICFCGKKGCMETEASGRALIDWLTTQMNAGINSSLASVLEEKGIIELEDVVNAVKKGDNLAIEGIGNIADKIGRGLAITINLFNPQLIVLSGSLSEVGDSLLLPVKTSIIQHSLSIVNSDTEVMLSDLFERAGLPGACLLIRDKLIGLV